MTGPRPTGPYRAAPSRVLTGRWTVQDADGFVVHRRRRLALFADPIDAEAYAARLNLEHRRQARRAVAVGSPDTPASRGAAMTPGESSTATGQSDALLGGRKADPSATAHGRPPGRHTTHNQGAHQ